MTWSSTQTRLRAAVFLIALIGLAAIDVQARYLEPGKRSKRPDGPSGALVIDGSSVHNVGELQMHLFNWGEWGSQPGTAQPYSFSPSAQWPAGSGIEYLFSAGLWVGAIRSGIPAVSTAAFEREFRPRPDSRDILYRSEEGAPGGARIPSPRPDDDGDGAIDEDPLDGYDNDGDGLVDEDYAAISRLMYACRYSDTEPTSLQIYTEHNPLGLTIRQESYQWASSRFDDLIGVEYHITNAGDDILYDLYVGMFVDGDVGPVTKENYWEDDMTGRQRTGVICTDFGPSTTDVAYFYDADGDNGQALGYFGVMFLGRTIEETTGGDPEVPFGANISSYANFSGRQNFQFGGDPTNDFERYEVMSSHVIESNSELARDYRMLVSLGPFYEVWPGSTIVVQMAFAIGEGLNGLLGNAANAYVAYRGAYFNWDNDPTTGVEGRETAFVGPGAVYEDICRRPARFVGDLDAGCDTERQDRRFALDVRHIPEGDTVWTNADCELECYFKSTCGYTESDSLTFRSGVAGRETQAHWTVRSAPPPPHIRIDDHAREGVVIYWDNRPEVVDTRTIQPFGFEGYQIWRADSWHRPLGTSVRTGPETELWSALYQADIINGFSDDIGLNPLRYEPLSHMLTQIERYEMLESVKTELVAAPDDEPACPPGVTKEVCDTLKALARWDLHLEGGRQYYRYVDSSVLLGAPYFYSVVAFDHGIAEDGRFEEGQQGDPASNFAFVEPKSAAQELYAYDSGEVYVVPNPVTSESMAEWTLGPTNHDPSGLKLEFRNLAKAEGVIRVYTMAGDLVWETRFDGRSGVGTVKWDLITRNGQDVTSGVYLFSVEYTNPHLERVVDKFTVIR